MTQTTTTAAMTNEPAVLTPDDPRYGFAHVVGALGDLIEATTPDMLANATPCPEFTVKELLEHCVLVVRRVATIGHGQHWSTVEQQATDDGWLDDYRAAAHDIMQAWADPAILEAVHEVPWGEFAGAVLMYTYTAELATHGWDLSQATGLDFTIADDLLRGALVAVKFIPAEGRETPEMPFSAVVDPGPDAPLLLQIAGWGGRNVNANTHNAPTPDDPRYGFAHLVDAVGDLMESTTPDMLGNATPCSDFDVKDLLDHLVFLLRSVEAIGQGQDWTTVDRHISSDGYLSDYRSAAHDIMQTWADPAMLEEMHQAPWAESPGAVVMHMYAAELATHGWDLSQATGVDFSVADDLLHGALAAMKFLPAEGRDNPDVPFSAVVDPGPDAPVLLQLAGWAGRNVNG